MDDTIPENTEYFTVMIGGRSNLHPNINLSPTEANIYILDIGKQRLTNLYPMTTKFIVPIIVSIIM